MSNGYTTPFGGNGAVFDEPADFTPAAGEGHCVATYTVTINIGMITRSSASYGKKPKPEISKIEYTYKEECFEDLPELVNEKTIILNCGAASDQVVSDIPSNDCGLIKNMVKNPKTAGANLGSYLSLINGSDYPVDSPEYSIIQDRIADLCTGNCQVEFSPTDPLKKYAIQINHTCMEEIGTCNDSPLSCNKEESGLLSPKESDLPLVDGRLAGLSNYQQGVVNNNLRRDLTPGKLLSSSLVCQYLSGACSNKPSLPVNGEVPNPERDSDCTLDSILVDCVPGAFGIALAGDDLEDDVRECVKDKIEDCIECKKR